MQIEKYSFGEITVNGKNYHKDLVIFPDFIEQNWWRKSGHNLCCDDITDVLQNKPEYLFIGTGKFGLMKVDQQLLQELEKMGIKVYVAKTDNAIKAFNAQKSTNKVGAFHLTC